MTSDATIQILRRTLCLIALAAYAVCLYFGTLLLLSYAFNPLLGRPWPLFVSILLRWIPVGIYIWLRHRPVYISRSRRAYATAFAVACISLSYLLVCFSAGSLSTFARDFLECTLDLWPCIVMLLTVTSRNGRFPNPLPNAATPIA